MHAEVLTPAGVKLVPALARFSDFYLVGGTALALQIGHRQSVDFDLFSHSPFKPRLLERFKHAVKPNAVQLTYRTAEQINATVSGVKITFFEYPYPVVEPFVPYEGLKLASIPEIAAMKASAIGQRLAYRDYVDWYVLLHDRHVTLEEVIKLAKKKFNGDFNDRLFLGQLVSLTDISTQPVAFIGEPIKRAEIESFLAQTVAAFKF